MCILLIAVITALTLTGCSSLAPAPLTKDLLSQQGALDKSVALVEVEPIAGELTLEQAQARALKQDFEQQLKAQQMQQQQQGGGQQPGRPR